MIRPMKIPEAVLSALFLGLAILVVVALIVHSLPYFGYDPRNISLKLWYGLQLSSAFALIPGILSLGFDRGREPNQIQNLNRLEKVAQACLAVFFCYAFFNWLIIEQFVTHGSTPKIVNGQYVLTSHGHATVISRELYIKQRLYEARAESGHWMLFYGMCIHALYRKVMQSRAPDRQSSGST